LSPFSERVLRSVRENVKAGSVSTYGDVARMIEIPGGARAVGRALSANPFPLFFPCHRIVGAGGRIGGFIGSSTEPLVELKKRILLNEGCFLFSNSV